MAPDPHTVKCAICGKEIVLPPGPERAKARCTACGSPLGAQAAPDAEHTRQAPPRRAQRPPATQTNQPVAPASQGTLVTCAVCGKQMVIPPGYENRKARCSACGTEIGALSPLEELDQGGRPNLDPLAAPDLGPAPDEAARGGNTVTCAICGKQMVIPPGQSVANMRCSACGTALGAASPLADLERGGSVPKKRPEFIRTSKWDDVREALLPGVLWGILGSIVGGVPLVGYRLAQSQRTGETLTVMAYLAWADIAILIGFVLCTTWVVVRKAAIGPVASAALCACLTVILGTFFYFFEWAALQTPPDLNVLENAVVCVLGGGFTGVIVHYTIAYFE